MITGPQIDAAEQLRSASRLVLPQEIALNGNPDELIPVLDFYELYGLADHPAIVDMLQSLKDHASVMLINKKANYVDQLAHLRGESETVHIDLSTGLPTNIEEISYDKRSDNKAAPEDPSSEIYDNRNDILFEAPTVDEHLNPRFQYVPVVNTIERILGAVSEHTNANECGPQGVAEVSPEDRDGPTSSTVTGGSP